MSAGARLFARYAFAPNELGYCGPAEAANARALFELGATGSTRADPVALARSFTGAWPYLEILAELSGIGDPLDEAVVRAYWLGSDLLDQVDREAFGTALLARIGPQAGHYWAHLTPELLPEASPTHGFHVFGVYPWTRLLDSPMPDPARQVLDSCRVRWGQVEAAGPPGSPESAEQAGGEHVVVRCRSLTFSGGALALGPARPQRVRYLVGGAGFVAAPQPGEWLALHWDWVCDRLTPDDVAQLGDRTARQLDLTNQRLRATRVAS